MSIYDRPSAPTLRVEFFFDCSSPWTYLAFHRLSTMASELDFEIVWRPILVGGIFNSTNPSVYEARERPVPAKADYMEKDLQDWAQYCGLRITWPPTVFPVNSVKAMRACILADRQGKLIPFATAVFQAYWRDDRDISQDRVLLDLIRQAHLDEAVFISSMHEPDLKQELRANTDEAVQRGAFGSPTIFVNESDMYFGNDRLPLVRAAILRAQGK